MINYVLISNQDCPNIAVIAYKDAKELNKKLTRVLNEHYDAESVKFDEVPLKDYYEMSIEAVVIMDGEEFETVIYLDKTFLY